MTRPSCCDIIPAYSALLRWRPRIHEAAREMTARVCGPHSALHDAVCRLLEADTRKDSSFRLMPVLIVDAMRGDPGLALPVCVVSRVWWAGADTFDDLTDGQFDSAVTGLSPVRAAVACTACITLLPQAIVERQGFPDNIEADLSRILLTGSLHAANGQLEDLLVPKAKTATWERVLRSYVCKSGAPYARDMAFAARLAGADPARLARWRAFGRLFGVLRQLANDRAFFTDQHDNDLTNGTYTLLVAHALMKLDSADAASLIMLRDRARRDVDARRHLRERLLAPAITVTYDERVERVRQKLSSALQALLEQSSSRKVMQWMIDTSADSSKLANL
jgi:hypothetical protein